MSDLDAVYQLWSEAAVRRFLFDDRQISLEEARSFIDASIVSFAKHGYGIWLFFEHQNSHLAGFSGLLNNSQELPGIIFGTQPQFWRRGYAREATVSIFRYAFDVLGLESIVADVDESNEASIRTLEALGMSRTRKALVNGHPLLYYEMQSSALLNRKFN
ncbi:GNAT family N-acetyltransferase [Stenomitos frigidus AS-A4]|uniref:GNAT family N-acetyltransferase n=2 Tax=Cyanobacteriota TaxID=1117 RepID=A0ABV0KT01_9CYAN